MGITAVILSLIYCLFWFYSLGYWSLEKAMYVNAHRFGEFMLLWSPSYYDNATDRLADRLYENLDHASVWSLGALGTIINFFGRLQDYVMCDVVLLFTYSLYQSMMNFIQKVETSKNPSEAQREELWMQYEYMKALAHQINDLFGSIIIIIHFYNALTISNFLFETFSQEERKVGTFVLGITATKVTLIYLVATKVFYQASQTCFAFSYKITLCALKNKYVEMNFLTVFHAYIG